MWELIKTTNKNIINFVGQEFDLYTPHRHPDGNKVLYVTEPGDKNKWYFCTSTIRSMHRTTVEGADIVEFRTSNSLYVFRAYKW